MENNYELKDERNNKTVNREMDHINEINNSLKQVEIYLKTIENETGYYLTFPICRKTSQLMLKFLLKKENYPIDDSATYMKFIRQCEEKSLIPKKCARMLYTIGVYTNRYTHGEIPNYQKTFTFLNSFNYFIKWYDNNFKKYDIENQFRINSCNEIISLLPIPTEDTYKSKPENFSETNLVYTKNILNQKKEESEEIENICKFISVFEKQLSFKMEFSSSLIVTASTLCELILKFILKKEGYENQNRFYEMMKTSYDKKIIPYECFKFLNIIRIYRNKALHSTEPSDEFLLNFLEAFSLFLIWFNKYYAPNDLQKIKKTISIEIIQENTPEIENLRNKLQLKNNLYKTEKIKNEKLFEENQKLEMENKIQQEKFYKKFDLIVEKLDIGLEKMNQTIEIQHETNENTIRIESKVDEINQTLISIKENISSMQMETSNLLENAKSSEEIEYIIEQHMNSCKDNIIKQMQTIDETEKYKIEKEELNRIFEDSAWNKLSDKSKTFLITSKVMFKQFNKMEDIIDYSGICILVTKALEVEIKKRFFTNFIKYLDENYKKDYSKYPTPLLYKNKTPIFSNKFTMGSIAYVLCHKTNYYESKQQKINNKEKLVEYCKSCIFSALNKKDIENLLYEYAVSIENIKETYRNPSAHTNELKKTDAEQCLNLIIDIEKLLKKMLDSFDI